MPTPQGVVAENAEALEPGGEPSVSPLTGIQSEAAVPRGGAASWEDPSSSGLAALVAGFLALLLFPAAVPAEEPRPPVGVSPGAADRYVASAGRCPTFSWSGGGDSAALELLIYRIEESGTAEVALSVPLPSGATSWTPAADQCLSPGRWAWVVRTPEGATSEPLLLEISARPSQAELERALAVVRAWQDGKTDLGAETLSGRGVAGSPRRADIRRGSATMASAASLSGATVAISGKRSETSGNAIGVVGETASPDGAGVAAANADPTGGPDLLLDGAAQGIPDTVLTESGLDRASAGDEVFEFGNSGAGSLSLRLDGADIVTTLTDEDTLGGLSCASGELPKSDGAGGWSCAADADTSYSAGNQLTLTGNSFDVVDGSSSGLDADLLDGLDSASFAAAVHNHDDRYYTEREMGLSGTASLHWENLTSVSPEALYSPGTLPRDNAISELVDPKGRTCEDAISVAIRPDGLPVVACASTDRDLLVMTCVDRSCSGVEGTVGASGVTVGASTSTIVRPDFSSLTVYSDGGDLAIYDSSLLSGGGKIVSPGQEPSVAFGADGFPIISFAFNSQEIGFLDCHDAVCSSFTRTDLDLSSFVLLAAPVTQTAVALGPRGFPVVAFQGGEKIGIAVCGDAACASLIGGVSRNHGGSATDHGLSLVVQENGALALTYCAVGGGSTDGVRLIILQPDGLVDGIQLDTVGTHAAVTVAGDGRLVVGYWDEGNGHLKYAHCNDEECSTWSNLSVDPASGGGGNVGSHVALSSGGDGRPLAVYIDDVSGTPTARGLKCANSFCLPFFQRR